MPQNIIISPSMVVGFIVSVVAILPFLVLLLFGIIGHLIVQKVERDEKEKGMKEKEIHNKQASEKEPVLEAPPLPTNLLVREDNNKLDMPLLPNVPSPPIINVTFTHSGHTSSSSYSSERSESSPQRERVVYVKVKETEAERKRRKQKEKDDAYWDSWNLLNGP